MRTLIAILILLSTTLAVPTKKPQHKAGIKAKLSAHSVTLSGCTDATPGVQFSFFRGTSPGAESSTPLNSSPLATCNYVDSTVAAQTTYYYTARAFCSTCSPQLSGPSNEVSAVVPADAQPAPPTGLTVGPIAKNNVPLLWKAPIQRAGVTVNSYGVYRCANANCNHPPMVAKVTSALYTDKPAKGVHYYEVKANDTINGKLVTTAPSNIVKAIVQ